MKALLASALVAAFLCVTPTIARAESSDEAEITAMAKEHYKLGLDAYKNGKYPEAIKELKKAYLLKRLPALLLNIGATYRKMADLDNAVYYYKKYLAEAPDAKDRGDVEKTLAELEHEKPGAGANAGAAAASEPSAPADSPAPAATTEWRHNPVDAAPPDQPLDVRVQMPVQKGVKVYVYYRGAGQSDFNQVLMRRHGGEKVGRIPAEALAGKSLQYYVEGKDDKGNVVKSFGSPSDPNIVRIDSSAAPQVVAGAATGGGEAGTSARSDLDDEAAPITGELAEKSSKKHHGSSSRSSGDERTARFGPAFWAGAAVAVLGIASTAIGGYFLFQAKSYSDVLTADSQYRDMNGNPYHFTDPNAQPYDDSTVEARGKRDNGVGIALTTVGGICVVGGAALMIVDQTILKHRGEKPNHSSAWMMPAVGPNMAGIAGGATF